MNNNWTLEKLRLAFRDFFVSKGHFYKDSAPLVPQNDPSLLFINSGMAPFRNYFLGTESPDNAALASCQKCIRAGGKHNDLEQIGYTKRHHTFFEMLGNFSFGAYFKQEAIDYAWEFLTDVLKIDKSRLYVTVHPDDAEAFAMWSAKMSSDRIGKLEENFWRMGDTGPCGPCSEIFYDLGDSLEGAQPGFGEEEDRFLEIWNLVFTSFDQTAEGMLDLPKKCIDTGAGLERIAIVLAGKTDTYEIPEFQVLIDFIEKQTGEKASPAHKVLADHSRAVLFLFADGITPDRDGRAYVLRKIIRRAARFAYKLGKPFLMEDLLPLIAEQMRDSYPEVQKILDFALDALKEENKRFIHILEQGMRKVEEYFECKNGSQINGDFAFMLYDTYGFPFEVLLDIAKEKGIDIDQVGFEKCKIEQQERSKKHWKGSGDAAQNLDTSNLPATNFVGYERNFCNAKILACFKNGESAATIHSGDEVQIALDQTVFYAESGGQIADQGTIRLGNAILQIVDVQKTGSNVFLHYGKMLAGNLQAGDACLCEIDIMRRNALRRYHTSAHLVHAALRLVLGEKVVQKGSLVTESRMRFDFTNKQALTTEQLTKTESIVNQWIVEERTVQTELKNTKDAMAEGAMALFGEKYPDQVRVVKVESIASAEKPCSVELCGGTHALNTGLIGCFKIIKESSIAAGVRRVEVLCGVDALRYVQEDSELLQSVMQKLKTDPKNLEKRVEDLLSGAKKKNTADYKVEMECVGNVRGVVLSTEGTAHEVVRDFVNKNKNANAVLVLSAEKNGKHGFCMIFDEKAQKVLGGAKAFMSSVIGVSGGSSLDKANGCVSAENASAFIDAFKKNCS